MKKLLLLFFTSQLANAECAWLEAKFSGTVLAVAVNESSCTLYMDTFDFQATPDVSCPLLENEILQSGLVVQKYDSENPCYYMVGDFLEGIAYKQEGIIRYRD